MSFFFLPRLPALNLPQSDLANQQDLAWMKKNVVDRYRFVKDPTRDIWTQQPDFKTDLGTPEFNAAASRIKKFFDRNNDWEASKKNPEFRTKDSCTNLLYITAARYLLVTHILYEQSERRLVPCARTGKQIVIPDSGVCYPAPYGSATCTSDYDVGLVGRDAGFLTEKFNAYFQAQFRKPSELVFDTNVYAFTLEYAMPLLFAKLPVSFINGVNVQKMNNEQKINYNMRELASAYYKVFKYNQVFFTEMKDGAQGAMRMAAAKSKIPNVNAKSMTQLDSWLRTFNGMNANVPMALGGSLNTLDKFRTAHNEEYQNFVKTMSQNGGYKPEFLGNYRPTVLFL